MDERKQTMILKPFMREGVMPLPVTFISTISKDGIRNIAPWSCVMPVLRPLDLICAASAKKRDTLRNIRDRPVRHQLGRRQFGGQGDSHCPIHRS